MPKISSTEMCLKITHIKLQAPLSGAYSYIIVPELVWNRLACYNVGFYLLYIYIKYFKMNTSCHRFQKFLMNSATMLCT